MNSADLTHPGLVVVAICGSLRRWQLYAPSPRSGLAWCSRRSAPARLIDIHDYQLGFCGKEVGSPQLEDVVRLRREVGQAQGIILWTPEYHGSFSGVLKNALDLLGFAEFEGKMIGLVGVSGGAVGAIDALNGLRTIGRALHAWVIPSRSASPRPTKPSASRGT